MRMGSKTEMVTQIQTGILFLVTRERSRICFAIILIPMCAIVLAEIPFDNLVFPAFGQLVNETTKFRYRNRRAPG